MKTKPGFELRQVGDEYVVITVGDATKDFNGMIKLNRTGVFIWKQLQNGIGNEELISLFEKEFSVDKETADRDVNLFLDSLKKTKCFVE